MDDRTHAKLINAVTEYDRKQKARKGYNPYALAHYAAAIGNIRDDMKRGISLRQAILNNTLDRLCDTCLKAVGEKPYTREEMFAAPVR